MNLTFSFEYGFIDDSWYYNGKGYWLDNLKHMVFHIVEIYYIQRLGGGGKC